MTGSSLQQVRILAIVPSTRGFGFAVLDGETLFDWGVKVVSGDKNAGCLAKVHASIGHYKPDILALEDFARTRRGLRTRLLIQEIIDLAPNHNVAVKLSSRARIYEIFFPNGVGTKETLAAILANRFSEELSPLLPPKRKAWMHEDYHICIFDAVAFGLSVI